MVKRIRNCVAKQVSYNHFWPKSTWSKRAVLVQKRPTNPVSISSKILKMYRWLPRNELLRGSGQIQVVTSPSDTKSANISLKQASWSPAPFATFGLRVQLSKLMKYLLIMIETSGWAICFLPIHERRKSMSIFRISENTQYLYRPWTTQKLVLLEPTIHFLIA